MVDADLVLEGGGVKGIGLVGAISVLDEHQYTVRRVAGTSAGAVVGSLVAAGATGDQLVTMMRELDYRRFTDADLLDRIPLVGPAASVLLHDGIYPGNYLRNWVADRLADFGVRTFGDLRDDDAGSSLPPDQRYRLVVVTADPSQGRMIRLPWDYRARYGLDPDKQLVADAVRASASIPFFFRPVHLKAADGKESLLVDGGVLSNFPIDIFDRTDGEEARWPTLGVKLSARPDANLRPVAAAGPIGLATAIVATMANAHDQMHIDDPCVAARTVFVDTDHVNPVDFDISPADQELLYANGRAATEKFLKTWDWTAWRQRCGHRA